CEFANDLLVAGFDVEVFDIASQPLGRLVPPECGEWIRRRVAVKWHFNASVTRFENGRVHLEDGTAYPADLLLSAVGLRPRTKLAADAGIECGRGIRVNDFLETSAAGVYAIGDCMEFEGLVLPFVMPIMHASKALASNVLGKQMRLAFPAMPVVVKTPLAPTVVSPPKPGSSGAWHSEAGDEGVKSLFRGEDGKLLGFCLCGSAVSEKNSLAKILE
ncbi:MAG TPA: FAD-dependent oxidoreductase, partial [Burkholderiales bacterium]|nr:FAD-dependent oxidoreductase [Burkholderiales bacterium]